MLSLKYFVMKEIQLSEKYKENFDVSSEDLTQFPRKRLRSGRLQNVEVLLVFFR